jgi:hypothetical protein
VTTSPIPVEQFGTWLGELVTAIQTREETNSTTAPPSPFQPGVGNFMHTIAQGHFASGSSHNSTRSSTQNFGHPIDHSDNSHTARAAAQLRHQIIHNLGSI